MLRGGVGRTLQAVEPADEPEAVARLADLIRRQNAKLAQAIRDGMDIGLVRADLDPDKLATALWASLNGLLALAWRPGALRVDPGTLDVLLASFVATVRDGLRAR